MPATRRELKKFIRELGSIRGRHTELVSVYVPAGYELIKIIQHLQEEQGTAKNIKDAKTRGNVIDSLERCVRHLRLFKKTPDNGMVIFAGNVSAQEGKVDIKVWSIEPPEPLKTRMYRCDQTFVLDLLRDMMESKEIYGLIVMDRREATIGFLRGTLIQKTHSMTSGVPGKIKAGGQSAMR
ncbi:MAG: peptide chain release factor 1, partial [Nanoarchaeota archaeon]